MRLSLSFALLCLFLIAPAQAQQAPLPPGKNGYDDLIKASEALRTSRLFPKVESQTEEGKTLTFRRAVLDEKAVQETVRLLRQGLGKTVVLPQPKSPLDLPFQNSAGFRTVGRFLNMRGYVLLADGRTDEAVENTRLALRLTVAIRSDSMLGGLTSVAMNSMATAPLASHLDQLSVRDCQLLFRLCQEWLDQPDPLLRLYEGEHRIGLVMLDQTLTEIAKPAPDPEPKTPDDDDDDSLTPEQQRQLRELAKNPQTLARFKQDTLARLDRFYQDLRQELAKPFAQRHLQAPQPDGTVAGQLIAQLCPVFEQSNIAFARDVARMRLLASHAAVLRYRWEHDKLPDSLSALNLGSIGQDPFTGADFRYERDGRRYKLYSVGPEGDADNPKTVEGRLPFSIVPGDF
jgi:hypothetical protein